MWDFWWCFEERSVWKNELWMKEGQGSAGEVWWDWGVRRREIWWLNDRNVHNARLSLIHPTLLHTESIRPFFIQWDEETSMFLFPLLAFLGVHVTQILFQVWKAFLGCSYLTMLCNLPCGVQQTWFWISSLCNSDGWWQWCIFNILYVLERMSQFTIMSFRDQECLTSQFLTAQGS